MSLLTSKRFFPLFWTQFLGAFNDNLFKNALIILLTFTYASMLNTDVQVLVTMAAGAFVLPFFLFSATAGQLADKYDRAAMARVVKLVEIGLMLLAAVGFLTASPYFLLFILFTMGIHSTFFGPIKYAILPQHLEPRELLAGNSYVEAGTFLAILLGTILGGVLVTFDNGPVFVSIGALAVAALGYGFSRAIPPAPAPVPHLKINWNLFGETWAILKLCGQDRTVFLSLLAISWFWFVGATYLAQLPSFTRNVLGADAAVVTLFLTLFSLGIGIGSMLCNRLLRGLVSATYVPLAAIGMGVFGIDLYFATHHASHDGLALLTLGDFLANPASWRIMIDLLGIAVSGGVYVVPLYAMIQKHGEAAYMARLIAGLNVLNALFMVASSILTIVLLKMDFTIPQIFLATAILSLFVSAYIVRLLPDALFRSIVRSVLGALFRVEVKGIEHFEAAGKRVLIIANHTSFLDAALIAAFLPKRITFAVNTHIAKRWWIRPVLRMVDALPVDPTNPLAIKSLIDVIRQDRIGMIFPEGRITVTGALMKVYEGPGMIADKANAVLLPVRIDGAQYSPFSYLKGKVRIRPFPKVHLTIMPPVDFKLPDTLNGRQRRQVASAQLYDVMSRMIFESSDLDRTLLQSLMHARRIHGAGKMIAEDPQRKPLDYRGLIAKSLVLGSILKPMLGADERNVGILLPNMTGTLVSFFAVHGAGRVPAMLNFSAGPKTCASACETAAVKTVITARRFVEMGKLETTMDAFNQAGIRVLYLEELQKRAGIAQKLLGAAALIAPELVHAAGNKAQADDAGVVLFTSGSEGAPKGVVLSHRNILSNLYQIAARVDFGPQDIVFNCLPMFHAFGLTGGTLLPVLSGIRTFHYPSPLHYRIVPELVYETNATIMFGTDTFLSGYARFAHPYDFHSLRYVFAGAEKLKTQTRETYAAKYGVRIFEGYGATETAPVISVNTPMHNKAGTVGRLMPGINARLEPVEGIDADAGRLFINGPNVMLGYYKDDQPDVLQPLADGWYDTGDIVSIDAQGYVTIRGRMKRFAKIGGEMVSLTAVESAIEKLYPGAMHAVVAVKDDRKGERLIVFTTSPDAKTDAIGAHMKQAGMNELSMPKAIQVVDALPLLGTGKTDYVTLQKMAEAVAQPADAAPGEDSLETE